MKIGYVVLYVNDPEACRRFWLEQVGMVEKRRLEAGPFAIVRVGFADQGFALELVPLEMMRENPNGTLPSHAPTSTTSSLSGNTFVQTYGGTVTQFDVTLRRLGISTTFVDASDPGAFAAAITPNTKFLFAEVVANPSGIVADIARLADIAHAHSIPLVVDAAWGGHFGFHPALPKHALAQGADALVTSAHKLLPAVSGAAIVLVRSERIDLARFDRAFEATHTTSPPGQTLASIDAARALLARDGAGERGPIDLAVGCQRQGIEENVGGWHHVAGKRGSTGLAQRCRSASSRVGRHPVDHEAYRSVVITRQHHYVVQPGFAQDLFNLAELDAEAPDLDLGVEPAEEGKATVAQPANAIPGPIQAARAERIRYEAFRGQSRPAKITARDAGAANEKFARRPDRNRLQMRIEHEQR